jgi:chromosome segregation ATPase
MKIAAIEIRDFKRIKHIEIQPDADRVLMLIGGQNAQGKSSILDALTMAFGGQKHAPNKPIRSGTDEAYIRVELDDGIVIERVLTEDKSHIEVRNADGSTFKSPQAMLDKLVGGRFLDPLAFLQLDAKKQRLMILELADTERRIPVLDEKRQRAFEKRTEVGRDLTKAEGELARLPTAELGTFFDVAALTAEMKEMQEVQREGDKIAMGHRECGSMVAQATTAYSLTLTRLESMRAELIKLEVELDAADQAMNVARDNFHVAEGQLSIAAKKWQEMAPRRAEVESAINASEKANREYYAAKAMADRRTETEATVQKLSSERTDLTKVLAEIDRRKSEILASAKLPAGLTVTDDAMMFNGVPFDQASGAEQFNVALEIAMAASPRLRDIWIRDGALLDDLHLATLSQVARINDMRCWVERVGDRDPGAIIIADGMVRP